MELKESTCLTSGSTTKQNSMVLAQRQTYRSMEQNRKPRDESTHLQTPYLRQRRQEYTMDRVGHNWSDLACMHACVGEGNGNPLQYSCLENPLDRGAWWAAVHRVAQSQTRLKRLSMLACVGEENGNPLSYSCLENSMDRGAWQATVHGVAESQAYWVTNTFPSLMYLVPFCYLFSGCFCSSSVCFF